MHTVAIGTWAHLRVLVCIFELLNRHQAITFPISTKPYMTVAAQRDAEGRQRQLGQAHLRAPRLPCSASIACSEPQGDLTCPLPRFLCTHTSVEDVARAQEPTTQASHRGKGQVREKPGSSTKVITLAASISYCSVPGGAAERRGRHPPLACETVCLDSVEDGKSHPHDVRAQGALSQLVDRTALS